MLTDLNGAFPNLAKSGYRRTSDPTSQYNCLAWALNDTTRWWEPDPFGLLYWPAQVRRTYSLSNYIKVCELEGYRRCDGAEREAGFEKIALLTEGGVFQHAARQLPDGSWTSKLGEYDDISHNGLDGFAGSPYGVPTVFMRRPLTA